MKKSSLLYKIINGIWDMCYIWKTEMRNVFRDEGVLIFCILVPLGYPLLYSWIYNNEVVREVDTAIVDLSHSHSSREFIRDYDASPDARLPITATVWTRRRNWCAGRQFTESFTSLPTSIQS